MNNPIHRRFFEFLRSNKSLTLLNISECLSVDKPSQIISLCNYILSASSLKTLIIKGNENSYLGKYTVSVIVSIMGNNTIEKLIFTNTRGGGSAVNNFKSLLKHQNIIELDCDGCYIVSCSNYLELIETVTENQYKRNIKFSFPRVDLDSLLKAKKLRSVRLLSIKQQLKGIVVISISVVRL